MDMSTRGIGALALLGASLLGSTAAHGSETLNTILGGGAGGVAGTMIGKELGGRYRCAGRCGHWRRSRWCGDGQQGQQE